MKSLRSPSLHSNFETSYTLDNLSIFTLEKSISKLKSLLYGFFVNLPAFIKKFLFLFVIGYTIHLFHQSFCILAFQNWSRLYWSCHLIFTLFFYIYTYFCIV